MFDASDRRAVPGDSVLWESSDDGVAEARRSCSESQASAAADAVDGCGGDLSEASVISGKQGTPQISVLAAGSDDQSRESGVGDGYHVCAAVSGLHVPGGSDRLAQSVRAVLAVVQQSGKQFLHRGAGGGSGVGMSGDLQHGPGSPVHESNVHEPTGTSWGVNQHGWSGSGNGQRVRGTTVVEREVRACLSTRSSDSGVIARGVGYLPGILQSSTSTSKSGVRDTVGSVSWESGGGGTRASTLRDRERDAACGGSGSAPVRCAHLRCATATTRRSRSQAGASLSNKIHFLV